MEQKKEVALRALLETTTLTEAAERAHISRKTLFSYLRDDHEFCEQYRALQRCLTIVQLDDMQARRAKALDVVETLMEDEKVPATVRLQCAKSLLDHASKLTEDAEMATAVTASKNDPLSTVFDDAFSDL